MTAFATDAFRYVRRMGRRGAKWLRLTMAAAGNGTERSHMAFVFGCHRSGTKMLLRTLDRARDGWTYPEHNRKAFDEDYRLRPPDRVEELIETCPARAVIFKPICDSHRADLLLDHFESRSARALWIYRGYGDVVNSVIEKWGRHFLTVMQKIAGGRRDEVGWRGERLTDGMVEEVASLAREGLSSEDAAALFWILRNRFYFHLRLDSDARVRLVSYERLVRAPSDYLPPIFRFVGLQNPRAAGAHIHAKAVRRRSPPVLSPGIETACEDLCRRLEAHHP